MDRGILTHIQLFFIGFSFGIIGPCFLVCGPIIISYIAGTRKKLMMAMFDGVLFLSGRFAAYVCLGFIAGVSGSYLKQLSNSGIAKYSQVASGVIGILLGFAVLLHKDINCRSCDKKPAKPYSLFGLFILGFLVGVSPCAPLIALLLEIALMSKNVFDAVSYSASFGMGTFVSGIVVVGAISGVMSGIAGRFVRSKTGNNVLRFVCAGLLVLLGVSLIIAGGRS